MLIQQLIRILTNKQDTQTTFWRHNMETMAAIVSRPQSMVNIDKVKAYPHFLKPTV